MHPNWKTKISFDATSARGAAGNKLLSIYPKISNGKGTTAVIVRGLTEDETGVLLHVNAENKLEILHNLKNLGGVRTRKEDKVVALLGLTETAKPVIIDPDLWEIPINVRAPLEKNLIACSSAEEFENASPHPTAKSSGFKTLRGVMPAPWATEVIVNWEDWNDLTGLAMKLLAKAKEFDENHSEDDEYNESAVKHVGYLLRFLWCVKKQEIYELTLSDANEDEECKSYSLETHQKWISTETPSTPNQNSNTSTVNGNSNTSTVNENSNPSTVNEGNSDRNSPNENPTSNENPTEVRVTSNPPRKVRFSEMDEDEMLEGIAEMLGRGARDLDLEGIASGDEASAMRMSAAMMSRVNETMNTANFLKILEMKMSRKKDKDKKDRTLDFHPSTISMLEVAASPGPDIPSISLPDSAMRFFNCKTAGKAEIELLNQFEEEGLGMVGFAHGLVQALWNGVFLWSNKIDPSNFSIFMVFKRSILDQEIIRRDYQVHEATSGYSRHLPRHALPDPMFQKFRKVFHRQSKLSGQTAQQTCHRHRKPRGKDHYSDPDGLIIHRSLSLLHRSWGPGIPHRMQDKIRQRRSGRELVRCEHSTSSSENELFQYLPFATILPGHKHKETRHSRD